MNYYNEIKNELINNEIYKKVKDYSKNKNDLQTYYNVGKILIDAQGGETKAKYGDRLIKKYSIRLTNELGKGYSIRSLKYMRGFYLLIQKGHALNAKLSWTHYKQILSIKNINKLNYYILITEQQNLLYRDLKNRIKSNEYERLDDKTKDKLITKNNENDIEDFIKNPVVIKNKYNYSDISEKLLKQLILEGIGHFLKELGNGFCYIDDEYKIKLGDRYNYIDILLFNIIYNCYVVVELKITELKSEYIGQIQKYMNYIDKNIKSFNHTNIIGIIICRKDNKFVMECCSDSRIFNTTYVLN